MAVDLWTDNSSLGISPRISFSQDLCQKDIIGIESHRSDSLLLESNDFDFCISHSFEQVDSCADELFSEGKILPLEIKKQVLPPNPKPPIHPTTTTTGENNSKKESLKEILDKNSSKTEEKSSSKSFWRFRRSSSCGNGYTRSLICSLPLLSRSNSTGSSPTPKKTSSLKDNSSKHLQQKKSSQPLFPYSTQQKASSKKNYGSYNNGIRINPVLNVPPPYISKGTVNLFGLGTLFCNGKDKNRKKRSEFS